MKKSLVKQSLVCGIIVLFIGTSVMPSFYGNTIQDSAAAMENNNQISNNEQEQILDNYASIPLFFTENRGQFPNEVLFQTHAPGAIVYLYKNKIVSVFTKELNDSIGDDLKNRQNPLERIQAREPQQMEMISTVAEFVDANLDAVVTGEIRLPHNNNYFIGNDPLNWQKDVPNYQSVIYRDVYPGIDLTYYGNNGGLKYDFIVHPGADVSQIQVHYTGINGLNIDSNGALQVKTSFGVISENAPLIYQKVGGVTHKVQGNYIIRGADIFGFAIDKYNSLLPLVIDPALVYSSYLGGSGYDVGLGITVDGSGNAYVTGYTECSDFPVINPYDAILNGGGDAFISKFSSSGNSLVYSTYLGGNGGEGGYGIAVDSSGSTYVTGTTTSSNFPMANPYDSTYNGIGDAFVSKLSPSGNSLVYSTYLGGSGGDLGEDDGYGIAVDGSGNAYVTGMTENPDFPVVNPYDGTFNGESDVFVSKFSPSGNLLVYSTFLGGGGGDGGYGIVVDSSGNAYVTGYTCSSDFPVVNPYDGIFNMYDAFVSKLSSSGNSLLYSTFLGGTSGESGCGIAVDTSRNAYVTGITESSDFPIVNPYDVSYNGNSDAFVTKFSPTGNTLIYSTYLGGSGVGENWDIGYDIAVDGSGNAYVTGITGSSDFPIVNPYDGTYNGGVDAFVTELSPNGNSLLYSTYLGGSGGDGGNGIVVDGSGNAYVLGITTSSNFPMVNSYDGTYNDGGDVFVSKFSGEGGNQPPNKPEWNWGPTEVEIGFSNTFCAEVTDPDNDFVSLYFDWGDNTNSGWNQGIYPGWHTWFTSKSWDAIGEYHVRVKAKDEHGLESEWSDTKIVTVDYTGIYPEETITSSCYKLCMICGSTHDLECTETVSVEYKCRDFNEGTGRWIFTFYPTLTFSANKYWLDEGLPMTWWKLMLSIGAFNIAKQDFYRIGGKNVKLDPNQDSYNPYSEFAKNVCITAVTDLVEKGIQLGVPWASLIVDGAQLAMDLKDAETVQPDITWERDFEPPYDECGAGFAWYDVAVDPTEHQPGEWWKVDFNGGANFDEFGNLEIWLDSNDNVVGLYGDGKISFTGPIPPLPGPNQDWHDIFIRIYGYSQMRQTTNESCLVNVVVYPPNGHFVSKNTSFFEGAYYNETDLNGDGNLDTEIYIPRGWEGNYDIFVKPNNNSKPSDTFSIDIISDGETIPFVQNEKISDINVSEPYVYQKPLPPYKINISGLTSGSIDSEYELSCIASTPYNTDVCEYCIDWGDGSATRYNATYGSGENVTFYHSWKEPGVHTIKAKALDMYGIVSNWSTPIVVEVKGYPSLILGGIRNDSIINGYHHFETGNLFFYLNLKPFFFKRYFSGERVIVKEVLGKVFPSFAIGFFNGAVVSDIPASAVYPLRYRFKQLIAPQH